ncbi:MAG TPA: SMI1/KNR4 family protein [Prosthecobacter sp.]
MIVDNLGPKITSVDVEIFEGKHHLNLPEGYRQFLIECNGGSPYPNSYLADSGVEVTISYLFSLGDGGLPGNLENDYCPPGWDDAHQEGYIQIGHDFGNQPIVLSTKGKTRGYVYLNIDSIPHLIAHSFGSLLRQANCRRGLSRGAYDDLMDRVLSGKPADDQGYEFDIPDGED